MSSGVGPKPPVVMMSFVPTLTSVFKHARQFFHLVIENADTAHITAQRSNLLCHPEGIAVLDLSVEQLRANRVDFYSG